MPDEDQRQASEPAATKTQRDPRPRRNPIIRGVIALLWLASVTLLLALLAAFVFPLELDADSRVYHRAAWVAFMVRTFSLHAAGVLGAMALLALTLRAPRLTLAAFASALIGAGLAGVSPFPGAGRAVTADNAGVTNTTEGASAAESETRSQSGAPEFTLMTANLWAGLGNVAPTLEAIDLYQPDIILLQEYTTRQHARLAEALAAEYPYAIAEPREDFSGQGVYSRFPLRLESGRLIGPRGIAPLDSAKWERQLCCVATIAGREVVVQNIHLPTAPMGRQLLALHHQQVRQIRAWIAEEPRPVVMGGDFNCTPMSAEAGAIRAADLTDAHRAVGTGLGTTWGHSVAWPGFRIDHVYTRGLTPLACAVGPDIGSDHRPVIVRVRLDAAPATGN
ncbi:MAG: endonuclease/exonuclease/phosphatase family protein [Phycisphaerales bacterium]